MPHTGTPRRRIERTSAAAAVVAAAWLLIPLAPPAVRAQEPSALKTLLALEDVLSDVIARNEKSVVAIARVKKRDPGDPANFQIPDLFNRARGLGGNEPLDADAIPNADFIPTEFGTGVVIDARGLILTNYHVVSPDSQHYVTTSQRKTYRARIKAADLKSDLAVLEIETQSTPVNLKPIRFGNAANLRKGQIVIALGNPYGIARDGQASAAWGIVSNLSRKAGPTADEANPGTNKPTLHHYGTLIQTDAKLNFGTSGGALVNLRGEMVGLTTSLAATAGYEQAAGYAIPVDQTFLRIVETLKQGREVEYGFLGVQPDNLDPREILAGKQGMRIEKVVPGMPAHNSHLRRDDVITEVNGQPIYDADGLVLEVSKQPVESLTRLTVLRNGQVMQVAVELAKSPPLGKRVITTPEENWRGMRVEFTSAMGRDFLVRNEYLLLEGSIAVSEVEEGSPAWNAGIRPEMIVSHVGNTRVHSPKEFWGAVADKRGAVTLREVRLGVGQIERSQYKIEAQVQ
jgi:S1-C subfamily serine protease